MTKIYTSQFLIFSVIFGFYLGPLRSDQILILMFGSWALLNLFKSDQAITPREIFVILLIVFFNVIGVLSFIFNESQNFSLLVLAQLENYLSLGAIFLIWLFYFKNENLSQLIKAQKTFIFVMCLVTTLNLLSWALGPQVLSIFHIAEIGPERPELQGIILLELLQNSGRYPGTFGQIFEAGTAYFLALLSSLVLRKFYFSRVLWAVSSLFLVLGGFLTGSKIFILGSAVLILYYTSKFSKLFFPFLLMLSTILTMVAVYGDSLPWQFSRLINNVTFENIFNVYTSARFAEGSAIVSGMKNIFEQSPIVGMGFGYLSTSDFSLYEVLAVSGTIGVIIYILTILLMYFDSSSTKDVMRTLMIIIFIFTISIAAPAVTANKIGFLLLTCLLSLKRICRET